MKNEGIGSFGHRIGVTFKNGPVRVTVTPADHAWQNAYPETSERHFKDEDSAGFWIDIPDGTIWAPGDSRLMPEHLQFPAPDAIHHHRSDNRLNLAPIESAYKCSIKYRCNTHSDKSITKSC